MDARFNLKPATLPKHYISIEKHFGKYLFYFLLCFFSFLFKYQSKVIMVFINDAKCSRML